jgi:FMN phosphatase YigB (HAD superfamily)
MGSELRLTAFIDVDDTLIDTQAAKAELDRRMHALAGNEGCARWWSLYEAVRADAGVVDIPLTLARFAAERPATTMGERAAFAELFMRFPFREFVYEGAFDAIAHLRSFATVAILSDGDPVYQTAKIIRSGLAEAVEGFVFVHRDKVAHLAGACAALPADRYVMIDDKPRVLERVRAELGARVMTVFVRQGRYAARVPGGMWSGASLTVDGIADVALLTRETLAGEEVGPDDPGPVGSSIAAR